MPGPALLPGTGPAGARRRLGTRLAWNVLDDLLGRGLLGELIGLVLPSPAQGLVEKAHHERAPELDEGPRGYEIFQKKQDGPIKVVLKP
jgi:hypothetical protein